MRRIVACHQCHRQYDASGKRPGDRFRCRCEATVVVRPVQGHEADVVRCSSCGATREHNASRCDHCGADFTVHEQDLQTVCPNCLARVSDHAIAGDQTTLPCPVCGPDCLLTSRRVRDSEIQVMECQKCGGFWIGLQALDRLLDREARQPQSAPPTPGPPLPLPVRSPYRPCAVCGQLMVRRNFGRSSGVIVDLCGLHGIWFDAQELAHVLRWIRSGNLEAARLDLARLQQFDDQARKRPAMSRPRTDHPRTRFPTAGPRSDHGDFPLPLLVEGVLQVLRRLL